MAPDANTRKEMALGVAFKIVCSDINNTPCIHITWRDVPRIN
jgi:hypothetical protein